MNNKTYQGSLGQDPWINQEAFRRRIYNSAEDELSKRLQVEYEQLKKDGVTSEIRWRHSSVEGWIKEKIELESEANTFVKARKKQGDLEFVAIKYLEKMTKHEKLLQKNTNTELRLLLANLCVKRYIHYRDPDVKSELWNIGRNALKPILEENANALMTKWEYDEQWLEDGKWDI